MAVTKSPRLGLSRWSAGTDLHPNRAEWDAQQGVLDDLVAIDVEVATWEARPAPKRGTYMWVVDEQRLYRATSTGWLTVAKIGGGGRGTPITIGAVSYAVEGSSAYAARADHTHNLPLATASVDGAMSKSDKVKLDAASTSATPGALVSRDSTGKSTFNAVTVNNQPTAASDAVRKDYVDAGDAFRLPFGQDIAGGSIDNIRADGVYYQLASTPITVENGYPISGAAGNLIVTRFSSSNGAVIQQWTEWNSRRVWVRSTNSGTAWTQPWREMAGTEQATASADGLMSKADKALLDTATASVTASAIVRRWSSGQIAVPSTPDSAASATSKSYVDSTAQSAAQAAASSAVGAIPLATSAVDGLMPKADKSKLDGATSVDTASRVMIRDSSGRARVKNPSAAQDISTKAYTDSGDASALSSANSYTDTKVGSIPLATASVDGLMVKGDKALLDTATANATANALVRRTAAGDVSVPSTPSSSSGATSKSYVDAQDAKQVTAATALTTADLDTIVTDGNYVQTSSANATSARNYPQGLAGLLVVSSYSTFVFQTYTTYNSSSGNRQYYRGKYGTAWSAWREIAFTDLATASADGLMAKADKALLDTATAGLTGNSIVRRLSTGHIDVPAEPRGVSSAVAKSYVDGLFGSLAGGKETSLQDWNTALTSADTGVISGWPKGCPCGYAPAPGQLPYQGFVLNPTWKFEVRPEGLGFVTQRATLLDSTPKYMIGFAWERVYNASTSKWSVWTCVAGDSGELIGQVGGTARSTSVEAPFRSVENASVFLYNSSEPLTVQRTLEKVRFYGAMSTTKSKDVTSTDTSVGPTLAYFSDYAYGLDDGHPGMDYTLGLGPSKMQFPVQTGSYRNHWVMSPTARDGVNLAFVATRYGPNEPSGNPWLVFNVDWPVPQIKTNSQNYLANR